MADEIGIEAGKSAATELRAPKVAAALYAAVKAATAEGFALEQVIALEGIKPQIWASADRAWKVRLARDEVELKRFQQEIASAEDWLEREVDPLRSDVAAWASFLDAYGAQVNPFEWLHGASLGMNDISRLGRAWERRMKEDPSIEKQFAELRKGPLAPLPALRVQPPVLRKSRGSTTSDAQAPGSSTTPA